MREEIEGHPLADQFNRLTPEQVIDAVEVQGARCTGRFFALNSYENRVYQLELEGEPREGRTGASCALDEPQGGPARTVVGKFYRPGRWTRETILAEHRFLAELAELEIPVAGPLELAPGSTLGEVEGIYYALFPRIGGRAPEELSDEQAQMLGRLIARIHNVGASRDEPARRRLTPETYGRDNLHYLLEHDHLPREVRPSYSSTVEILLDRITPLFAGVPAHRVHGDCHLGNLLWAPRGPTFLDFDDLIVGPAVQDIWMLVPSFDAEGQRQRQVLLEAYRQFRELDPTWLRLVEPLRALRYIHYSTWIARRWRDPIFPRTFPHFGTLQYWEGQVQDLREQIARIDHELE
jgi:Ser/Thr protein kinase RdoA (MazF antagonist)